MRLKNDAARLGLLAALTLIGAGCTSDDADGRADSAITDEAATTDGTSGSEDDGATDNIEDAADDTDDVNVATDVETPDELAAEANDNVPDPADLSDVEQLWIESGTSPELASCYRGVLEGAGVEEVADLNELTEIMANLDAEGQQAINDCVAS